MQDSTNPHTAKETIWELCGMFGELDAGDRIIRKNLWPSRFPDLKCCDF
jgi:hypothetical protein